MPIYKTSGTCSRAIDFEVENSVVTKCRFEGGCAGNTQGVAKLAIGRNVGEVIAALKGIQCRNGTSCPDQLARALEEYVKPSAGKSILLLVAMALSLAATPSAALAGALKLASPFTDGAVLQRDRPVPVWGTATGGATVEVEFAGQRASATAGEDGRWRVDLKAMPACKSSRTLTVRSQAEELRVADVLVGEVWICSGQSNMQVPFWSGSPRARDRSGYLVGQITWREHIRCARLTNPWSAKPNLKQKIEWKKATSSYLIHGGFSAVGLFFALTVDSVLRDVPIGLIGGYVGATGIDTWTPRSAYGSYPELKDIADYPVCQNWTEDMARGRVYNGGEQPTVYYNGKFASVAPYSARGILWYQGERNTSENEWRRYRMKMHAFYDGFKKEFENDNLKLYFVQLAPWGNPNIPYIQMEQEKFALEEPNAGMAVINDIGNLRDIHPNDKESVGRRLAMLALKRDYGMSGIVADSPRLESAVHEGEGKVRLKFAEAKAMFALDPAWCYMYDTAKSAELGFEIAGEDGVFKPAKIENLKASKIRKTFEYRGMMDGEGIVVSADGVAVPKAVRYLHVKPWFGRITNEAGLPLGAFAAEVK